jgi:hypothetical protein
MDIGSLANAWPDTLHKDKDTRHIAVEPAFFLVRVVLSNDTENKQLLKENNTNVCKSVTR